MHNTRRFEDLRSVTTLAVWIFCLAFVSVGLNNSELGFSPDSRIYSTIARNIVRTGDWFALNTNLPNYKPYFADHPHLNFWLVALIFKFLPPADWSSRIVGHLFYLSYLGIFYWFIAGQQGKRVATYGVLLLWSWYVFSNTFSSVMTDPGALFFGSLALFLYYRGTHEDRSGFIAWGGFCFALALLTKGMAALGFLPSFGVVALHTAIEKKTFRPFIKGTPYFLFPVVAVLGLYVWMIRHSSAPDFISIYFSRQFENRIGKQFDLSTVFNADHWKMMSRFMYSMWPLSFLGFFLKFKDKLVQMVFAAFLTFTVLLPVSGLTAPHHYIMVMPWAAWLIAIVLDRFIKIAPEKLVALTTIVSIAAVLLGQYLPISTHGGKPSLAQKEIARLSKDKLIHTVISDVPEYPENFLDSGAYAWYGDVTVQYPSAGIAVREKTAYFLHQSGFSKREVIKTNGWCLHQTFANGELYLPCDQIENARRYSTP